MTLSSTITIKGQMTIPKQLRDALGIKAHERVLLEHKGDSVIVRRASLSIAELAGSFKTTVPYVGKKPEREGARAARLSRYQPKSA
jgi:AbrB family looped-hinge helix DNA binding protein